MRPLALPLVELSLPADAVHTPGIAHVIADKLSRIHAPDGEKCQEFYPEFWKAKKTTVLERNVAWYRAVGCEPVDADGIMGLHDSSSVGGTCMERPPCSYAILSF